MPNRLYFAIACVILFGSLGIRIGTAIWWQGRLDAADQRFAMGDSDSYWYLATQIADGKPYQYLSPDAAVFRTPGYPWILSWFTPTSILAARILGCCFGALAVLICIWISATLFDRSTSLIAGTLAAIYPGAITTSVLLLSEAPFMPLMMLILWLLWLANNRPEQAVRWNIMAGVLSGIAILIRPSWLLFMPFYFFVRLIMYPHRIRTIRMAVVAGASIAVVMLPWWIRNYQATGHFILTTLQVGPSLYDGFGPQATGGSDSGMEFSAEFANQLREDVKGSNLPSGEFEYELNRRLASTAMENALANPGRTVALALKKVYRTWWPLPSVADMPGGLATRLAFAIGMLGIVIPAIVHMIRSKPQELFPYIMPAIYFTLLHAVFVGSIRYRQPAVLALVIVAAPEIKAWGRRLFLKQSFES